MKTRLLTVEDRKEIVETGKIPATLYNHDCWRLSVIAGNQLSKTTYGDLKHLLVLPPKDSDFRILIEEEEKPEPPKGYRWITEEDVEEMWKHKEYPANLYFIRSPTEIIEACFAGEQVNCTKDSLIRDFVNDTGFCLKLPPREFKPGDDLPTAEDVKAAHEAGHTVEMRNNNRATGCWWVSATVLGESWNEVAEWLRNDHDFRIKPLPPTRPWTQKEAAKVVHQGALFREFTNGSWRNAGAVSSGYMLLQTAAPRVVSYETLADNWTYTLDAGVTWHPCHTVEDN